MRIHPNTNAGQGTRINNPSEFLWKDDTFTVVSHNIRGANGTADPDGTKDISKIETLCKYMEQDNIDVYLLQETWLTDNWQRKIHGTMVLHHGPPEKGTIDPRTGLASNPRRGGVAILLGKRAQRAWNPKA